MFITLRAETQFNIKELAVIKADSCLATNGRHLNQVSLDKEAANLN